MSKKTDLISHIKNTIKNNYIAKKSIEDFPAIKEYIYNKFSHLSLDFSNLSIYIVSSNFMSKCGINYCSGCYIEDMNIIFVKKDSKTFPANGTNLSKQLSILSKYVDVEDILVHEIVHAVSAMAKRANRAFTSNEEEFVFTNCVDFYLNKSYNEDDIINRIMMPFLVNDIMDDENSMLSIWRFARDSNLNMDEIFQTNSTNTEVFMEKYAQKIVPIIANLAIEKGKHIIERYNKHGRNLLLTDNSVSSEFSRLLNFD